MAVFGFLKNEEMKNRTVCTSFLPHRSSKVYRENDVQIDGLSLKRFPNTTIYIADLFYTTNRVEEFKSLRKTIRIAFKIVTCHASIRTVLLTLP